MPDEIFSVYRRVDIGGTDGLERAGTITVQDDDGFRDDFFDDIEQAPASETSGDQAVLASDFAELDPGDTIRTRGIFRFTNNVTGETYDLREIFSQTAGNPVEQLFVLTSDPPDWLFDGTSRSFALLNSDGTLPYADIVCFAAGTMIRTTGGGDTPVEALKAGELVQAQDGRSHPVSWIGSRHLSHAQLAANPKLRPIRIAAGALGPGLPSKDLMVSPQHRMLVRSKIAKRIFGQTDILVPAHKLVGLDGIAVADDITEVHYFHLLFSKHRIIYANDALTESLFTGPEALKAVSDAARAEIRALFPEVFRPGFSPVPACTIARRGKDIRALTARHSKNAQPLVMAL